MLFRGHFDQGGGTLTMLLRGHFDQGGHFDHASQGAL